jgi:hypothetical protein
VVGRGLGAREDKVQTRSEPSTPQALLHRNAESLSLDPGAACGGGFDDPRAATARTPSEKSSSRRSQRFFTVGPLFEIEHRLIVCVRVPPRYPNAAGLAAESPRRRDGASFCVH